MKQQLISILKSLKIYHPLQSFYQVCKLSLSTAYHRLLYRKYKGKEYTCNFCGAQYEQFIPEFPSGSIIEAICSNNVIAGYGNHVYCPFCKSKNRERLVLAVIQKFLDYKDKKVLHFSPEKHLYRFLKEKAKVTTVDIMPAFYKNIDRNIRYADATCLDFPSDCFDIIIANHILEHIPADVKAMGEMHRVLKKDGVAILQVPYSETLKSTIEDPLINDPAKQEALFGQKDHVRIYALKDYVKRLQSVGFTVDILTPSSLSAFRVYAIQERESVFLCYKHPHQKLELVS